MNKIEIYAIYKILLTEIESMQYRFMKVYDSTLYSTLRIRNILPQRRKNSDESS